MTTERVCIQSLSDYNNGRLIFEWWDLDDFDDKDAFMVKVAEWLAGLGVDEYGYKREEWMLADWEGELISQFAGEYGIDETYWQALELLQDSYLNEEAVAAGLSLGIPLESLEDAYIGDFEDDQVYLDHLIENEVVTIPEHLECFIDWERMAQAYTQDVLSENGHYFYANW